MAELNLSLALVGAIVLLLGLFSRPLDRSWASLPMLAFLTGVFVGPVGLGWLDASRWGGDKFILEQAAHLTLAISLMGIALRLPPRYLFDHWQSVLVLIVVGMPLFCLVSAALAFGFLDVGVLAALAVGAAVCATDPVIASSIVTGGVAKRHLPGRFRHTLSSESALNDGLALPLVMVPVLLMTTGVSAAANEWVWRVLLWEVGGAAVLGVILGLTVGRLLRLAERRDFVDQPSFLSVTLALTLLAVGLGKLLGTDGLVVVFVAGVAFDQEVQGKDRSREANIQEAVNLLFTLPVFMLFGLMIPLREWLALGWSAPALILSVLLLRRLPVILLLRPLIPDWRSLSMAGLAGWFGPIGISALYYGLYIHRETGTGMAWVAVSLLVAASLIVHGVTAAPFGKWYGRSHR
ncbi:cation:proton antiporter [Marinobacter lacisalsi]|uniref:Cation:proton antiporter n=1 Tax=Marinobacter lacisalsi TaxID=475979 RepID=A0ABV8QM22_9GAMM